MADIVMLKVIMPFNSVPIVVGGEGRFLTTLKEEIKTFPNARYDYISEEEAKTLMNDGIGAGVYIKSEFESVNRARYKVATHNLFNLIIKLGSGVLHKPIAIS